MTHSKKQRTRIEDLSTEGNELFEPSEEHMQYVIGGGMPAANIITRSNTCASGGGEDDD